MVEAKIECTCCKQLLSEPGKTYNTPRQSQVNPSQQRVSEIIRAPSSSRMEEMQLESKWEGYVDLKNRPALRGRHGDALAAATVLDPGILSSYLSSLVESTFEDLEDSGLHQSK
ncbi:hypothetical protein Droror1_Dr00020760 [Drosera rotundifolia]